MLDNRRGVVLLLVSAMALASPPLIANEKKAPGVESCNTEAWLVCAQEVKKELAKTTDAKRVVELSLLWADAFSRRLDHLEAAGLIQRSKSDKDLFVEKVWDEISPLSIAVSKAEDALLKHYLKRFAVLLKMAQPVLGGLKAFFTPSQTATDLEQLENLNNDVQGLINERLAPYLIPDLNKLIEESAKRQKQAFIIPLS